MSRRSNSAAPVAPRGKAFAVVRTDHVVGGKILLVKVASGIADRSDADRLCANIDQRLSPTVILVDKAAAA